MTEPRKPKHNLSDMEFDEVSLVGIPCNQESDVVLFKGQRVEEPARTTTRRSTNGRRALARYTVAKMGPDASDVHTETVMGGDKKKRKKKKQKKNDEQKQGDVMIEVSSAQAGD